MSSIKSVKLNNGVKLNNDVKLNYIRHFICRNIKKINFVNKIEDFEIDSSDESEYEYIDNEELYYE